MKINRAIPIEKLMKAMVYYIEQTNRRITIEYILLRDVNDHTQEAEQLAELLRPLGQQVYVNLIPYNPVDEHSQYQRSEQESVLSFYDTLKKGGVNCKIRQEHGTDIDAACGQLRSKQIKKA
jgi:23S rRNA (adenine2503-C2)-methyltransferase